RAPAERCGSGRTSRATPRPRSPADCRDSGPGPLQNRRAIPSSSSREASTLSLHLLCQGLQQLPRARLALADVVVAVEEGVLLGEDQARALAVRLELHGRQRGGDGIAADGHAVGDDDAPLRHDVLVDRVVGDERPALEAEAAALEAADTEIGLEAL